MQAIAYGNVYVAQVAMGANPQQTLQAFREAEAYPGPSLILAYCHCIAHGIDMQFGMKQQDLAVASGYWPLFRYNPAMREVGENPFRAGQPAADDPVPRLRLQRDALHVAWRRPGRTEAEALMDAAQAAIGREVPQLRGDGRLVGLALPSGGAAKCRAECAGCRNDVRAGVILPLPLREGVGGRGRTIARQCGRINTQA